MGNWAKAGPARFLGLSLDRGSMPMTQDPKACLVSYDVSTVLCPTAPVLCPMPCAMSHGLVPCPTAHPFYVGPLLCPMAVSLVPWPCPVSHGPVLCPMSYSPTSRAHGGAPKGAQWAWLDGPIPEFHVPRASCVMMPWDEGHAMGIKDDAMVHYHLVHEPRCLAHRAGLLARDSGPHPPVPTFGPAPSTRSRSGASLIFTLPK